MARYLGPKCKLSRREGTDLLLKSGVRDYKAKCKAEKLPGEHGDRRPRLSDFGLQLRENRNGGHSDTDQDVTSADELIPRAARLRAGTADGHQNTPENEHGGRRSGRQVVENRRIESEEKSQIAHDDSEAEYQEPAPLHTNEFYYDNK